MTREQLILLVEYIQAAILFAVTIDEEKASAGTNKMRHALAELFRLTQP